MKVLDDLSISQFNSGDAAAFKKVFENYVQELQKHSLKLLHHEAEAHDAVAMAMYKLWKADKHFETAEHIRSWLYTVVGNECIDRLRKMKRITLEKDPFRRGAIASDETEAFSRIEEKIIMKSIHEEIEKLPAQQREIIRMHYINNLSVKDIADNRGVAEQTVRNQLAKARKKLRQHLSGKGVLY